MSRIQKRVRYLISAEIAQRPLLYPLGVRFGVAINIRAGQMTEEGGSLDLDLVGEAGAIAEVIDRMRAAGADIVDADGADAGV